MKTLSVSMLGSGLSAALLLAGCLQDAPAFLGKGNQSTKDGSEPIEPPSIYLDLSHAGLDYGCSVYSPMNSPYDCPSPFPAGDALELDATIDWYGEPGVVRLSDTCGGAFVDLVQDSFAIQGRWQAPSTGTECTVILDALDLDDNVLASAVLSFDFGVLPPRPSIQATLVLEHQNGTCRLTPSEPEVECGPVLASDRPILRVEVDWDTAMPGIIELGGDVCAGPFNEIFNDGTVVEAEWQPLWPGQECTESVLLVSATSADNWTHSFLVTVPLI